MHAGIEVTIAYLLRGGGGGFVGFERTSLILIRFTYWLFLVPGSASANLLFVIQFTAYEPKYTM